MEANKAAIKAMLVNRVGDVGLVLAMLIAWGSFGCVGFAPLFNIAGIISEKSITLLCFFLFIGAAGKSAQFGLHTWLPDAMEGRVGPSSLSN